MLVKFAKEDLHMILLNSNEFLEEKKTVMKGMLYLRVSMKYYSNF